MACTYPVKLDDGRVVRIVGHRRLRQLIDAGDYLGRRIILTYEGKLLTRWGGHYEKLYTISLVEEPRVKISQRAADYKEQQRNRRRRELQDMIEAGHTPRPGNLKEFLGEPWAEAALEEAQEAK